MLRTIFTLLSILVNSTCVDNVRAIIVILRAMIDKKAIDIINILSMSGKMYSRRLNPFL
jgi:hypothetical protein